MADFMYEYKIIKPISEESMEEVNKLAALGWRVIKAGEDYIILELQKSTKLEPQMKKQN